MYIGDEIIERIIGTITAHPGPLYAGHIAAPDAAGLPEGEGVRVLVPGPWRTPVGVWVLSPARSSRALQRVSREEAVRQARLWLALRYPSEVSCSPHWCGGALPIGLPADSLRGGPRARRVAS